MRPFFLMFMLAAVILPLGLTPAAAMTFDYNFESGVMPADFSGQGSIIATPAALNGLMGHYLLGNSTGGNGNFLQLTLNGLPQHSAINLSFYFLAIDTWESTSAWYGRDYFKVKVGDTEVHSETYTNYQEGNGYVTPWGATGPFPQTAPKTNILWSFDANNYAPNIGLGTTNGDMGYHLVFTNIPHTGDSLTIRWYAYTPLADGWGEFQGGGDESWGLDNISVQVVPLPGALWLLGSGLVGLLAFRRKPRA